MASNTIVPVNPLEMERDWKLPDRGKVGLILLIISESVLFSMFVAVYLVYLGKSLNGPYPKDVLELPVVATICLLSSSLTVYLAERALANNHLGAFKVWWAVTILLGLEFLVTTGFEWHKLIYHDHLTMATNQFGATYYALVGLHASHVVVGLVLLILVLWATLFGFPIRTQFRRVLFLSWYWHFVDAVWVIVFTVVYLIGR